MRRPRDAHCRPAHRPVARQPRPAASARRCGPRFLPDVAIFRSTVGICRANDQSSWAADVTLGGWISARTTLGGELGAWRLGGDEATQRVMMVSAVSQLYPLTKAPAFVKLGVGMMTYRSTDGEQALSARSLALQAGFGVDIPVTASLHRRAVRDARAGRSTTACISTMRKVTGASRVKLVRFGLGVGVRR